MIRIGVAGWSYPDWEGVVYPKPKPRGFDQLVYLADYVSLIEINSTYYHPGSAKTADSWVRRTKDRADFRFTVKLWQKLTHERVPYGVQEIALARAGPEVLERAGILGAVLAQFPWSFRNTEENREWIAKLVSAMAGLPMAVEVRHGSWQGPAVEKWFQGLGAAEVALDQPVIGESLPPTAVITAPVGYVRFHGRNYRDWFRKDAGRDDRYNYLYPEKELAPWSERIEKMATECRDLYIVFNNHFQGRALVNALQMRRRLGQPVSIPPALLKTYPHLEELSGESGEEEKA